MHGCDAGLSCKRHRKLQALCLSCAGLFRILKPRAIETSGDVCLSELGEHRSRGFRPSGPHDNPKAPEPCSNAHPTSACTPLPRCGGGCVAWKKDAQTFEDFLSRDPLGSSGCLVGGKKAAENAKIILETLDPATRNPKLKRQSARIHKRTRCAACIFEAFFSHHKSIFVAS